MKFNELPINEQERLRAERLNMHNHPTNTPFLIEVYSEDGMRKFSAERYQYAYKDNKGGYLPFGGGSQWKISYSGWAWGFDIQRDDFNKCVKVPINIWPRRFSYKTFEDGTRVEVPRVVKTKKEVIALIKELGCFDTTIFDK